MLRTLSNRLEAGLNTRLTKTLREENLIPWWICAVRSTTVTWKYVRFPHLSRATVSMCPVYIYLYIVYLYILSPPSIFVGSVARVHAHSHAHTYVVAWWQAGVHTGGSGIYMYTHISHVEDTRTFLFVCISKVPLTRLLTHINGRILVFHFSFPRAICYIWFASFLRSAARRGGTLSFSQDDSFSLLLEKVRLKAYLGLLLYSAGCGWYKVLLSIAVSFRFILSMVVVFPIYKSNPPTTRILGVTYGTVSIYPISVSHLGHIRPVLSPFTVSLSRFRRWGIANSLWAHSEL